MIATRVIAAAALAALTSVTSAAAAPTGNSGNITLNVRVNKLIKFDITAAETSVQLAVNAASNVSSTDDASMARFKVIANTNYGLSVAGTTWAHSAYVGNNFLKFANATNGAHLAGDVFLDTSANTAADADGDQDYTWDFANGNLTVTGESQGANKYALGVNVYPGIWNDGTSDMPVDTIATADENNDYVATVIVTATVE